MLGGNLKILSALLLALSLFFTASCSSSKSSLPISGASSEGTPPSEQVPEELEPGMSDGIDLAHKRIFVTKNTYTPTQINGLSGADAICRQSAQVAGLSRNYVAILSDSSHDFYGDRVPQSTSGKVYLVSGSIKTLVSETFAGLFSADITSLLSPVNIDQDGNVVSGEMGVYTGTYADGSRVGDADPSVSCSDWTSSSGESYIGDAGSVSEGFLYNNDSGCVDGRRIYCISQ